MTDAVKHTPDGYRHILRAHDGVETTTVDDCEEHPFGDDLHDGDRVETLPLHHHPSCKILLRHIRDLIAELKLHPATNQEYDAGYIAARTDAFAILQEVIDNLPPEPMPEAVLSIEDQKAQGKRCGCRGSDDYCPCQNVPDVETRRVRKLYETRP